MTARGCAVRFFFRGCGLRCRWCQNPEALFPEPETPQTIEDITETLLRDRAYYSAAGGGVTPYVDLFLVDLRLQAPGYTKRLRAVTTR